jgi:hypothetical protein
MSVIDIDTSAGSRDVALGAWKWGLGLVVEGRRRIANSKAAVARASTSPTASAPRARPA